MTHCKACQHIQEVHKPECHYCGHEWKAHAIHRRGTRVKDYDCAYCKCTVVQVGIMESTP